MLTTKIDEFGQEEDEFGVKEDGFEHECDEFDDGVDGYDQEEANLAEHFNADDEEDLGDEELDEEENGVLRKRRLTNKTDYCYSELNLFLGCAALPSKKMFQ